MTPFHRLFHPMLLLPGVLLLLLSGPLAAEATTPAPTAPDSVAPSDSPGEATSAPANTNVSDLIPDAADLDNLLKPRITTLGLDDPARTPVTLDEVLKRVKERNLTIQQIEADMRQAEAQLRKTRSMLVPTITASLNYTLLDRADVLDTSNMMSGIPEGLLPESDPIVIRHKHDLGGVLQAQMPLINFALWKGIRTARSGVAVTESAVEQVRYALCYGTAQAFYMAIMARAMIELQEEQIRSTAYQLEVATRREATGAGLRIDVLRASTLLEQTRQALDDAYLSLDTACDALAVLMGDTGLPMPAAPDVPQDPDAQAATDWRDGDPVQRPDLDTLRSSRDLAKDQVRGAQFSLLPSVNGVWRGTHQFTEMSAMGDQTRTRWSIMLMLDIPLFNWSSYENVRVQRAALEKADLQLQDAEQNAAQEIRQARRNYESALRELDTSQVQVALASEALLIATKSYESGAATSLDVTDARRVSFSAEVGQLAAALKVRLSLLALWQATGEEPTRLVRLAQM